MIASVNHMLVISYPTYTYSTARRRKEEARTYGCKNGCSYTRKVRGIKLLSRIEAWEWGRRMRRREERVKLNNIKMGRRYPVYKQQRKLH
jgi:hypothetical protein